MAAAAAAPATTAEPLQGQGSHPSPNPANTQSDDGFVGNRTVKTMIQPWCIVIAAISIPSNGLAAVKILNDALRLYETDISPAHESFLEAGRCAFLTVALWPAVAAIGLKRMWLIVSGILCASIFACSYACTGNDVFIFRTVIEIIVAVTEAISLGFVGWFVHSPWAKRYSLSFSILAIISLYASVVGFMLSTMFPWQWSLSIIATIETMLFALSIKALPADPEPQEVTRPFGGYLPRLTLPWMAIEIISACLGLLSYFLAVATRMPQSHNMILPVVFLFFVHTLQYQHNAHMKKKRKVAQQSEAQWPFAGRCITVLSLLSSSVSYVALSYMWTSTFGDLRYISTVQQIFILQSCTGGAIFTHDAAMRVLPTLTVELDRVLKLHPEVHGANAEGGENKGAELAYAACPLTASDSIRVIHLLPGSPDDELQCSLAAVRLGEQPVYDALSYCWGQRVSNRYISLRPSALLAAATGDPVPITKLAITDTLHDALVYLRDPQQERTLWVDQICINQRDDDDRSTQVKLMQDIYSSTRRGIVWLRLGRPRFPEWLVPQTSALAGFFEEIETAIEEISNDHGLESDLAVGPDSLKVRSKRALRDITNRVKYGLPDESDERWTLFYGILDAPWFSRLWIVQEVAWPRVVKVHYTNLEISWEQFTRVINFVESLDIRRLSPRRREVNRFFQRFRALQACRESTQAQKSGPLDQVLAQHRMAAASDPRDHVYGLMGLASQRPCLDPDYEVSTKQVYLETAKWAIQQGCLDILGLCGDPSNPSRPKDLPRPKSLPLSNVPIREEDVSPTPSWVPDFSDTGQPHSLTGMGVLLPHGVNPLTRFDAAGGPATAPTIRENDVMEVLGQPIGEVQEACAGAEPQRDTLETHMLQMSTQIEAPWLHQGDEIRESVRLLNILMFREQMARKLAAKGSKYQHTGESMEDAVLRTCLLGKKGEDLEKLRPFYKYQQLQLKIWGLLTFGQGCKCSSPLIGFAIMAVLLAAESLLCRYRYDTSSSNSRGYLEHMLLSLERRLFCGTNGLIGLAPPWALPGDRIFILQGGKVPVILRRTTGSDNGPHQFIGEAYVHGAMHGEMFDVQQCEMVQIA